MNVAAPSAVVTVLSLLPPPIHRLQTNGILSKITNVLFPPSVLLALRVAGIPPYVGSPVMGISDSDLGACAFTPANATSYDGVPPLGIALFSALIDLAPLV